MRVMDEELSYKTDPVCKMLVDEAVSSRHGFVFEHNGVKYFFCALGCKERFEKDPEKYLKDPNADWIKG